MSPIVEAIYRRSTNKNVYFSIVLCYNYFVVKMTISLTRRLPVDSINPLFP